MDFDKIVLSNRDFRRLKKSSSKEIDVENDDMLITLDFIEECRTHVPGYAGIPTGMARITKTGNLYLEYEKRKNREYRVTRTISVVALIVSILSLLFQVMTALSK